MIYIFLLLFISCFSLSHFETLAQTQTIITSTKRIVFEEFPKAFNPSILKTDRGILMSFRYSPPSCDLETWENYIGIVLLNDDFEPVTRPQLVYIRSKGSEVTSHCEDARLFSYRGRIFLIYNDNMELDIIDHGSRRDMHVVELFFNNNRFITSAPLKLIHQEKSHCFCQKNWVPFEWDKKLWAIYTIYPHEILYVNFQNGACYPYYSKQAAIDWNFGPLRSSTPPQIVDGEFLTFFHSSFITHSDASCGHNMYHYFIGAYTFSPNPPFQITRISSEPIVAEGFYTQSDYIKRVIFPGGFIVSDPYIYMAYGKDDREIWIATIDKENLKTTLKELQ